jgi:hypothetical protein
MGCARPIHPTLFMCTPHWKLIPDALKILFHAAVRKNAPEAQYQQIARECIQSVAEQEGLIELLREEKGSGKETAGFVSRDSGKPHA